MYLSFVLPLPSRSISFENLKSTAGVPRLPLAEAVGGMRVSQEYHLFQDKAYSKSALKSNTFSIPTERRTKLSLIPRFNLSSNGNAP